MSRDTLAVLPASSPRVPIAAVLLLTSSMQGIFMLGLPAFSACLHLLSSCLLFFFFSGCVSRCNLALQKLASPWHTKPAALAEQFAAVHNMGRRGLIMGGQGPGAATRVTRAVRRRPVPRGLRESVHASATGMCVHFVPASRPGSSLSPPPRHGWLPPSEPP